MQKTYIVVRPLGDSPDLILAGDEISRHRTAEGALRAIDREIAAVKRLPGGASSWVDRAVLVECDGELFFLGEIDE